MIIRPEEFDPAMLKAIPLQKRKGRPGPRAKKPQTHRYKDLICAFDIETSRIQHGSHEIAKGVTKEDYISFMYVWQLQIGTGITIIGRYWDEFVILLDLMAAALQDQERIVVFTHNLSYEFSFLRDQNVLGDRLNEESVFCIKARRICKFLCCGDKIEFRCSYIHSNMGLDEYTKKLDVEHKKQSGEEFDYSKVRYPWTELTENELKYASYDVIGLVECIQKECEIDHDDLYSLPLTSTGYIRRSLKKSLEPRRDYIERLIPPLDTYKLLREAFRGGDTHASRFYAGKILPGPIRSVDRSSSYPDVQCNMRFPVSEFFNPPEEDAHDIKAMVKKIKTDRAVIARIGFEGIRLRDQYNPVPYIPADKCRLLSRPAFDNGRILSADYLEITVTDKDFYIITRDYTWDGIHLEKWQFARYGPLPDEMKNVIIEYYVKKTELKGVEGMEVLYNKSKNLLNAVFGCSSQDPVRLTIQYKGGEYIEGATIDGEFYPGTLDQYEAVLLDQSKPVMPYQWGVW